MLSKFNLYKIHALTILILILCIFKLPYSFYIVIRYVLLVLFTFLSIVSFFIRKSNSSTIIFLLFALIFQPIIPFSTSKIYWIIIDLTAIFFLLYPIIIDKNLNIHEDIGLTFIIVLPSLILGLLINELLHPNGEGIKHYTDEEIEYYEENYSPND